MFPVTRSYGTRYQRAHDRHLRHPVTRSHPESPIGATPLSAPRSAGRTASATGAPRSQAGSWLRASSSSGITRSREHCDRISQQKLRFKSLASLSEFETPPPPPFRRWVHCVSRFHEHLLFANFMCFGHRHALLGGRCVGMLV